MIIDNSILPNPVLIINSVRYETSTTSITEKKRHVEQNKCIKNSDKGPRIPSG